MNHAPHLTIINQHREAGLQSQFWTAFNHYMLNGYIHTTPEYFIMFCPIKKGEHGFHALPPQPQDCDAWYVHSFCGDMRHVDRIFPYPLPWVGFRRWQQRNEILYYPFNRLTTLVKLLSKHG